MQLRTDDAVMFTGLVRALVITALHEIAADVVEPDPGPELVQIAMWQAARHGLSEDLIGLDGRRVRAGDAVSRLLEHIGPALDAVGDTREITSLVHRLRRQGSGADRQRQALAQGGIDAVIAMMIDTGAMP